jgi:hypothetical protein
MTAVNPIVPSFTGGTVGDLLVGRVDIQSYPAGSAIMENFWPYAQGPMARRPGLQFVDTVRDSTRKAYFFPFIYSSDQSYLVVANDDYFRFYSEDALITSPTVATTIANGDFSSMSSWTDSSTIPSSASVISGRLWLDSNGAAPAVAQQAITVALGDLEDVHVLRFEVFHGPINVRIGSSSGNDDILSYSGLRTGIHQLEFTPNYNDDLLLESGDALLLENGDNLLVEQGTTIYLQFWHTGNAGRVVDNVSILSGGTYELGLPWSDSELPRVQWEQIGDVLYLTHPSYTTRRLERRGHRSWSLTQLLPNDGPFETPNTSSTTLQGSATSGEITLTASDDLFTDADQGVLYKLSGEGQTQTATAGAADIFTDGIKVTGVGTTSRTFTITLTGTFSATVTLQRSSGNENSYADWQTYTTAQSVTINDAQDNQTWYYRLGVKSGAYSSGSVTMTLTYSGGSSYGIVRIITVNSPTTCTAEVLDTLPNNNATSNWRRGAWNGDAGYPAAVTQGYGRLWFGRGLDLWSSGSDNFTSFDDSDSEDDKSIAVTIAAGTADGIRALAFLDHLCILTQVEEMVGIPNTASEPVSPSNFQVKPSGFEGCKQTMPVTVGGSAIYVHRSGRRVMQFTQNPKALSETSYISIDLNRLDTEITEDGIISLSVQREPERRIFAVLESGKVQALLFRREEEIAGWSEITTRGRVEETQTILGSDQDKTYFVVRRKLNGSWVRCIERLRSEVVLNDEDYCHLDSSLTLDLDRPATNLEASGNSGTITITSDDDAFVLGDVGSIIWLAGGRAEITDYTSATEVEAEVIDTLQVDEDGFVPTIAKGRWGLGAEVNSVSGADHLEGETVHIWADQAYAGTAVVTSGVVTLPWAASIVAVGLAYTSRWRSLKLAYGADGGSAVTQPKVVKQVGYAFHRTGEGVFKGPSFRSADMKPIITRRAGQSAYGSPVALYTGEIVEPIDARLSTDARTCLKVVGPAPCTVICYVPHVEEIDRR